jgi:type IV secretion system protein VirB4
MNWEHRLLRHQIGRGALHNMLAPIEFIDGECFATRTGHVGLFLRLDPVPFECLDQEQLDELSRRWEAAVRVLEPEMRVYQYLFKRELPEIPHRPVSHPVLARTTTDRVRYLRTEKGLLFSIEVCLALLYEITREAKFTLPEKGAADLDHDLRIAAHQLRVTAASLIEGLRGALTAQILPKQAAFLCLRRMLNYAPEIADARLLSRDWDLDWQIGDSSVDCDGVLKVDRYFVRTLTLKEPPLQTYAHILRGLYELPCNAVMVTEWKPLPVAGTDKIIRNMRRHYNHVKSSLTNFVGSRPKPQDILVDDGKQALIQQLGKALEEIQVNNIYFGEFCLSVVLYHEDPAALRTCVSKAANALLPHGAAVAEHLDKSALAAWLAIVPGNAHFNLRRIRVSNVNYADLSFVFGPHHGEERNPHLHDEFLAAFPTCQHTVYRLNLHQGQVGHTLVTGCTGAGKSYFLRFLAANIQKYEPYTVVIDIARGFEHFTKDMGGSYMELGRPGLGATINPFCLDPTPENLDFLFSFVRMLVETDKGPPIANADTLDLYKKIQQVYKLPPDLRRLGNLSLAPHLQGRLARWIHDSADRSETARQFAHLFDNQEDTVTFSNFQTFNFPKLAKNPEALEALLYYVLHRSLDTINSKTDQPSFVFIDEAWTFFRHPSSRNYIELALKDWRKCNASIILATHTVADLGDSLFDAITTCCLTKIHGPNPGIDTAAWQKAFRLNRTQAELITRLIPERQFLVQDSGVINLVVDPKSHALYSNRGSL